MVYGLFASSTAIIIIAYVLLGKLPATALIALLPMPLAFYALSGAVKYGTGIGNHPAYMKANVAVTILTPLLLAISISMA